MLSVSIYFSCLMIKYCIIECVLLISASKPYEPDQMSKVLNRVGIIYYENDVIFERIYGLSVFDD